MKRYIKSRKNYFDNDSTDSIYKTTFYTKN